jgi:hypothetical protein
MKTYRYKFGHTRGWKTFRGYEHQMQEKMWGYIREQRAAGVALADIMACWHEVR